MDVDGDEDCVIIEQAVFPEMGKKHETKESSSGKKMKQTVLAFKCLDSNLAVKCIANSQPSNKRRLADAAKLPKNTKKISAESSKRKSVASATVEDKRKSVASATDVGDKEVSSSCEMEGVQPTADKGVHVSRHSDSADLRKFVYAGLRVEVSTTSSKEGDLGMDVIIESENEADAASSSGEGKVWSAESSADVEDKENIPIAEEQLRNKETICEDADSEQIREASSNINVDYAQKLAAADVEHEKDIVAVGEVLEDNGDPKNEDPGCCVIKVDAEIDLDVQKRSVIAKDSEQQEVTAVVIAKDDVPFDTDLVKNRLGVSSTEAGNNSLPGAVVVESEEKTESVEPDKEKVDGGIAKELLSTVLDGSPCKESAPVEKLLEVEKAVTTEDHQPSGDTTPTSATKRAKIPFPSSKKQKLEQLERQKRKEELEQQKKEKKEQKERERQEAKMQKEKEKQEKEKEKEEKKRLREEERQKRLEQQEEEKRKKEEARLEEKKRKEEEKRKKDEEKLEKDKVSQKEKRLMQNFFFKTAKDSNSSVQQNEAVHSGPFMPFEAKKDMLLAPISRFGNDSLRDRMAQLESHIESQSLVLLYLDELKRKVIQVGKSGKTWPSREDSGDVMVVEPKTGCMMKAKFFKFHENYRPAYYGTWRKRSEFVRGRQPFGKDTKLLDYEMDSDDEWEEEEPGESLSHSEGEDEAEPDAEPEDEEGDGFFVPHGYLSEGEGCENDDDDDRVSPEKLKARQLSKARNWEAELNSKKRCEMLRPICIGISWWTPDSNNDHCKLNEYEAVLFEPQPIVLPDPSNYSSQDENRSLKKEKKRMKLKGKGTTYIPVPATAIPDLIRLVHGNKWGTFKLVKEFQAFWRNKTALEDTPAHEGSSQIAVCSQTEEAEQKEVTLISKRSLIAKIREIAIYERRPTVSHKKFWYVNTENLEKYGLSGLPVPTEWKWMTKLPEKSQKHVRKAMEVTENPDTNSKHLFGKDLSILQFTSSAVNGEDASGPSPAKDATKTDKKEVRSKKEFKITQKILKNSMKKHSVKRLGKTKRSLSSSIHSFVTEGSSQLMMMMRRSEALGLQSSSRKLTTKAVASILSKNPLVVIKRLQPEALRSSASDSFLPTTGPNPGSLSAAGQLGLQSQKRSSDGSTPDAKRPNLDVQCMSSDDNDDCIIVGVDDNSALCRAGREKDQKSKPVYGELLD